MIQRIPIEQDKSTYYEEKYQFNYEDWFSENCAVWSYFFDKENLINKKINYLEIGCFEGRSTLFVHENIKDCKINVVDSFEGGTEHSDTDQDSFKEINYDIVLNNFTKNVSSFKNKVKIFKMTSNEFFQNNKEKFDLIYVDGSHYIDDVVKDCANSFNFLNKNGLIIFDDFLWNYYKNINSNPVGAILPFIKKNIEKIEVLYINRQVILKKID